MQFNPISYRKKVYRNIFTCSPSQYLLDDICDAEDFDLVDQLIQMTSEIDHHQSQPHRPFQYGIIESDEVLSVFKKEKWGIGRFGDGLTYGVWYAAEDEMTSVYEAAWTAYRLARDNVLLNGEVYTSDRSMFEAKVSSKKAIDLTKEKEIQTSLIDNDYAFCQKIGRQVHQESFDLLRTPSARRKEGVCVPIFSQLCIGKISYKYGLSFHILPSGQIHVSSGNQEMNFTQSADQLHVNLV
ncbi:MAG: RES family NAD+ phosphorylase [Deltaproteobacteria bacterium]|nr:MAG: RES family NAD+ phosphorylase [Deltaproteobacteria bacterium]